jgi:hypothetical protein
MGDKIDVTSGGRMIIVGVVLPAGAGEPGMQTAARPVWILCPDYDGLTLRMGMTAHNGDRYVVELALDNYREIPPAIEFVDRVSGVAGGARNYPKGHDSFFNTSGPCICAPINRKAYKLPDHPQGLHADWTLGDWANSNVQNFPWSGHASLAGILGLIQARLDRKEYYQGRMAS